LLKSESGNPREGVELGEELNKHKVNDDDTFIPETSQESSKLLTVRLLHAILHSHTVISKYHCSYEKRVHYE